MIIVRAKAWPRIEIFFSRGPFEKKVVFEKDQKRNDMIPKKIIKLRVHNNLFSHVLYKNYIKLQISQFFFNLEFHSLHYIQLKTQP